MLFDRVPILLGRETGHRPHSPGHKLSVYMLESGTDLSVVEDVLGRAIIVTI